MAILALYRCVGPKQWKAVLVILNLLNRDLPSAHRVALRAIRTKFSPVNISMAVGAVLADICKYRLHVALGTQDLFMHSTERIVCFVVIEFRLGANRPPGIRHVTVFAGNI